VKFDRHPFLTADLVEFTHDANGPGRVSVIHVLHSWLNGGWVGLNDGKKTFGKLLFECRSVFFQNLLRIVETRRGLC